LASNPWDESLRSVSPSPSLLQSWGYGEVQRGEGWRVERIELPGTAATVLLRGPGRFSWAYVPRGPVPCDEAGLRALIVWAQERRLAGLRVEPDAGPNMRGVLQELGFRSCPGLHPETTLVVPLQEEQEMLAGLRPKHRYNIRLAARRGVEVTEDDDVEELVRQSLGTARRQRISVPSAAAYRRRLRHLEWCRIYVAHFQGEALAAVMVARFGPHAYYLFGGSSGKHRDLMPSYALQWRAMRDARQAGCTDYDLWGVPPGPDQSHQWAGLWQFKTGFGGSMVEYCGAFERVLDPSAARVAALSAPAYRIGTHLRPGRLLRVANKA